MCIRDREYAGWTERIDKIGVKIEVLDAISAIRKSLRAVNVDEAAERRNLSLIHILFEEVLDVFFLNHSE